MRFFIYLALSVSTLGIAAPVALFGRTPSERPCALHGDLGARLSADRSVVLC